LNDEDNEQDDGFEAEFLAERVDGQVCQEKGELREEGAAKTGWRQLHVEKSTV